ncbi:hypothetical protein ABZ839_28665 [Streptomyces cellulosae]
MNDHALRRLRQDGCLAELAARSLGFDRDWAAHGHVEEVRLSSGGPLEVVAGDDTGGTYFVCADGSVLCSAPARRARRGSSAPVSTRPWNW